MQQASTIDPRDAASPCDLEPQSAGLGSEFPRLTQARSASETWAIFQACIFTGDLLAVVVAGVASYRIWNGALNLPPQYWGAIVMCCAIFLPIMQLAGMYRLAAVRHRREHILRLTGVWAGVVLILFVISCLTRQTEDYSSVWMLLWAVAAWIALVGTRFCAAQTVWHFREELLTRIAVVGDPISAHRCAQRLDREAGGNMEIVGVYEARDVLGARHSEHPPGGGLLARLRAAEMRIDEVVLALPYGELPSIEAALTTLGPRVADIKIGVDLGASRGGTGGNLVLVPVWRRPLAGLPAVLKRAIDLSASTLLLTALLPLMAVIAVIIKFDSPGPALFRQRRFGFDKQPFELYKFRSMRREAGDDPAARQARRRDPRVTRVGRFLRHTSLDELPQLLNVIKGDMSLVGPRPHPTPLDEKFAALIEGYVRRHHVKPGITGWAQVHGWRGETDTLEKMEHRLKYDIYYIKHWSLLLDVQILFRTLTVVFGQQNAY